MNKQETLDYFMGKANQATERFIEGQESIKSVLLTGSVAREYIGQTPLGSSIHSKSDLDFIIIQEGQEIRGHECLDPTNDMPEIHVKYYSDDVIRAHLNSNPTYFDKFAFWILSAHPMHDPGGIFTEYQEQFSSWELGARKQALRTLWDAAEGEVSNAFYFQENRGALFAVWSLRKAFDLMLDIGMIIDGEFRFSSRTDVLHYTPSQIETLSRIQLLNPNDSEGIIALVEELNQGVEAYRVAITEKFGAGLIEKD